MSETNSRYLIRQSGQLVVTENDYADDYIAILAPPEIIGIDQCDTDISDKIEIFERYTDCGDGLFKRVVKIVNYSNVELKLQVVLNAETGFVPNHWLIPGVMYNGNSFGRLNSPKGLERNGEPWCFAYDRSGIPACTLTENANLMFSVFASDRDPASLRSSCSMEKLPDGKFRHKIIYPVVEAPVSYTDKNVMTKRYDEYLELPPGGAFEAESYIFTATPSWTNYGYFELFKRAFSVLKHDHLPSMNNRMVKDVSLAFLKESRIENDREIIFGASYRDYTHPIGNNQQGGPWDGLTLKMIEKDQSLNRLMRISGDHTNMGFSSQGFMSCRMLLKESLRTDDRQLKREVLDFMGTWIGHQQNNGLVSTSYPTNTEKLDISHLGWGAGESVKIYSLLKENGEHHPEYLLFAKKLCSFFVDHFQEDDPFGMQWSISGEKLLSGGCTGSFMLKAMLELYEVCEEQKYLECAEKALNSYFRLHLDSFLCSGGAIDCDSVDKESSWPFIYSALCLYRKTGKERYLEYAHKAAIYFLSWMFCYDALYEADSDFSRLGYHTSGGTLVSVEHQCIDPYGSVVVPDLYDLSEATGNSLWREVGELIWINSIQCTAGPQGCLLHGMLRPAGSQNECFAQTRWTKYRSSPKMRGHLNDFIGIWLPCFKLYAIDRLKS